jgi:hypothetical protein
MFRKNLWRLSSSLEILLASKFIDLSSLAFYLSLILVDLPLLLVLRCLLPSS